LLLALRLLLLLPLLLLSDHHRCRCHDAQNKEPLRSHWPYLSFRNPEIFTDAGVNHTSASKSRPANRDMTHCHTHEQLTSGCGTPYKFNYLAGTSCAGTE
jgi:hypothetical protein